MRQGPFSTGLQGPWGRSRCGTDTSSLGNTFYGPPEGNTTVSTVACYIFGINHKYHSFCMWTWQLHVNIVALCMFTIYWEVGTDLVSSNWWNAKKYSTANWQPTSQNINYDSAENDETTKTVICIQNLTVSSRTHLPSCGNNFNLNFYEYWLHAHKMRVPSLLSSFPDSMAASLS